MQIINLDDPGTEALIVTMLQQRNLVPVLGAGFSKGAPTHDAAVPDADEFTKTMLRHLRQHVGDDADALSEKTFTEVAEHFLNPEFVPTAVAKDVIRKYFTGVKISGSRKSFLECPWPYIYTLNIDDCIESNSIYRNKVLPNRPISETARKLPCVYKAHGDATDELIYDEPSKIIFSTGQYVRSLMTNQSMLNSLKTDLIEQNTLFVGCSLNQEIDLLFALAEYQGAFPEGRRSIFVSKKTPNKFELAKLSAHGINSVLLVPDYDNFYSLFAKWGKQALARVESSVSPLLINYQKLKRLNKDRGANLSFLLREPTGEHSDRYPTLPDYCIHRDIEDAILKASENTPLSLIRGRRFSGKTILLRRLAYSAKAKNVYLMDSNSSVSDELLDELCGIKNGLFLFDTNVLNPDTAYSLGLRLGKLKELGSSAVVAVNRTEPDVVGSLIRFLSDEADFELDSRFSKSECSLANRQMDALGILRFECGKTLLDNTFSFLEKYPNTKSVLLENHDLNEKEVELLLVIAIVDKAYSSLATALDIRTQDLFALCDKLAPILDMAETSRTELRDTNSRHKVVANSKIGLAFQLRHAVGAKGNQWLADRFSNVVTRLVKLPKFTSTGHSMYMFDAVNFILSQAAQSQERSGFRPVVRTLYESLQPILNSSADYWLQRAKAVLSLEDDEPRLVDGIGFALKSYHEATRERTTDNAEFSIALLYGKLCHVTKYGNQEYVQSAIKWFSQAISNYHRNPHYVQAMLEGRRYRKGWFDYLCDHLESDVSDMRLLPLKGDVQHLLSVRRNWAI